MNKEAKGQDMNVEDVRDDVEDSASSSLNISVIFVKTKDDAGANYSFRGEDICDNFLSHLVVALHRKNIETFVDEELTRGDEISPAFLKAIEESKISVKIFSKNYASSKWCLDELVKILKCHKKNGQVVIPVFYNVDPSDVRNQKRSFKDAFVKHDKQFNKPDAKLVKEITADILEKLEKLLPAISDSDRLVGLESRVEQVKSLLAIGLLDVRLVGIWGMGGIGKTTIGVVFNQFSQKFEGKYFMANVREESEKCGVLVHLRNQVLSKVLGENFDIGTQKIPQYIRDRLQRMKVFIVLDDVNNCAFKENHCPEDLLKHSETAVHYAKGNPLALQVLGSSFYGKSKPDWVNALNNLKRISGSDIYGVLKIGYDELS
ncbi:putative disease resistance protein At4g11170 [Citrus clementina]|nr:putative disease resistance protein At4g11170 [Citrus x clementina]